jgi:hypothetical protein
MSRSLDILYRLARFLAGIPQDVAAYLPAVLERADLLMDFGIWGASAVAGELFTTLLFMLFTIFVWRRLSLGWRRRIRATYEHIFPSGTGSEDARLHEAAHDGEEILREEVRTLRERIEAHERRTEEIVDRQQRRIDRLERELSEARRSWWRRLFGR